MVSVKNKLFNREHYERGFNVFLCSVVCRVKENDLEKIVRNLPIENIESNNSWFFLE